MRGPEDAEPTGPPERLLADLVVPRRLAIGGGVLGLLAATGLSLAGRAEASFGGPTRSGAARSAVDPTSVSWVVTRARAVALTFDDGPDPASTPQVLDLLAAHGARATFFVVGRSVDDHPDLTRRIVREGHLLANHTYDHAPLDELAEGDVRDQVRRGRAAIERFQRGPRLLRPPRGYTDDVITRVAAEQGERQVFWSCCLESTKAPDDRTRGRTLADAMSGGDIALLHDGGHTSGRWAQSYDRAGTVRGLASLLDAMDATGLHSLTVPELLRHRA